MNMKKIIGNRITLARKANGLTIKELSERSGLTASRIGNWEQGTRSPGPAEAKILSVILNVAASWMLCLTDNPSGDWVENTTIT
ncbi:helix-turn-helix transcriptional regulator [Legionella pneumophila serogroup 1]|nr:helix-turn-helix transcriptional regulator [Legionella pneumophila]HAT1766744.1 helix-turn-helix transcriptional regulator [Legionella pneumophila]HAT8591689.1 helix-turn-helix domain-containing protein [Legionella pneumophila]HAT9524535.1 helix-turn-helix domain-containing protein [Legionella pneumophila subsp. pneumophila]